MSNKCLAVDGGRWVTTFFFSHINTNKTPFCQIRTKQVISVILIRTKVKSVHFLSLTLQSENRSFFFFHYYFFSHFDLEICLLLNGIFPEIDGNFSYFLYLIDIFLTVLWSLISPLKGQKSDYYLFSSDYSWIRWTFLHRGMFPFLSINITFFASWFCFWIMGLMFLAFLGFCSGSICWKTWNFRNFIWW